MAKVSTEKTREPDAQNSSNRLKRTAPASKADILLAIKKQHMDAIVARTKDHEYRKYLISADVKRMWFYVSSPDQTLRYIATISRAKKPGEVENESIVRNAEFNAGKLAQLAKYGYEITELYKLVNPIPLIDMQKGHSTTFPQRFSYVNRSLLDSVPLENQIRLF